MKTFRPFVRHSIPFSNQGWQAGASLESQHRAISARDVLGDDDLVLVAVDGGRSNVISVEGVVDVGVHIDVLKWEVIQQEVPLKVTESI